MVEQEVITNQYPNLILPPTTLSLDDEGIYKMQSEEVSFAALLIDLGLCVYREPEISGFNFRPDFFVFNSDTESGVLVEMTFRPSNLEGCSRRTRNRKKRQFDGLERCGIPLVILFKEDLLTINRWEKGELFKGFRV